MLPGRHILFHLGPLELDFAAERRAALKVLRRGSQCTTQVRWEDVKDFYHSPRTNSLQKSGICCRHPQVSFLVFLLPKGSFFGWPHTLTFKNTNFEHPHGIEVTVLNFGMVGKSEGQPCWEEDLI